MALGLPALCSDFFGGKWEEPGDAIQVTWGIWGFPVNNNNWRGQTILRHIDPKTNERSPPLSKDLLKN